MSENKAQSRANQKQNEKRLGAPIFSTVRFKDAEALAKINSLIKKTGKTKEEALIAAFSALEKELGKS
ncbi:hypothetical protein L1267_23040 [Pseudoalteromonas sp. OFAV1]|uniref:hypothetical protein n=1 Tax=Pseudoalteromonas sp. OFAV1 TaxID=2908892 RepID=UPI001F486DAF|nr:hypothetical protein [Pseudoalteromonas sp. OFAV1]MCF2903248.1 hypothetical protein [Pseudoalteromonas sp. OFAV1]